MLAVGEQGKQSQEVVMVSINDKGKGIDSEILPKLILKVCYKV